MSPVIPIEKLQPWASGGGWCVCVCVCGSFCTAEILPVRDVVNQRYTLYYSV